MESGEVGATLHVFYEGVKHCN